MTPSYVNDAGVQFVRDHLANVPRPDRAAAQAIRQWAGDRGLDVNPIAAMWWCFIINGDRASVGSLSSPRK